MPWPFFSMLSLIHISEPTRLCDRRILRSRLQQFDLGLTYLEESGADFLFGYLFDGVALQPQGFFVKLDGLLEVAHCDTDVFDMIYFHDLKVYEVDF